MEQEVSCPSNVADPITSQVEVLEGHRISTPPYTSIDLCNDSLSLGLQLADQYSARSSLACAYKPILDQPYELF